MNETKNSTSAELEAVKAPEATKATTANSTTPNTAEIAKATTPTTATAPGQVPASTTTSAPSLSNSSATATGQGIQNALTGASLPEGYLAEGRMVEADGVMRAEYTGTYAEELAKKLKPLPASTFYSAFLREAKALRKKKTPYGAQKNCAMGMVTQAKKLSHRSKNPAPPALLEMITAATATVKDPATFEALYMHLDAIYSNMLCS